MQVADELEAVEFEWKPTGHAVQLIDPRIAW